MNNQPHPIQFPAEGWQCYDCGGAADVIVLNAYGPGKHQIQCHADYIGDYAPGVDHPIQTSVYGESAEVTTLLDSDTCDNCGVNVITSIKHGREFLDADAEYGAFLASDRGRWHPASPLLCEARKTELAALAIKYPDLPLTMRQVLVEQILKEREAADRAVWTEREQVKS